VPARRVHKKRETVATRGVRQVPALNFSEEQTCEAVCREIGETALESNV
jgi:hypothetical protein